MNKYAQLGTVDLGFVGGRSAAPAMAMDADGIASGGAFLV